MTSQPASSATLYLIRHGETAHNAAGRWQGHLDVPLAQRGEAQAAAAAKMLLGRNIVAVYSSDLSRAKQTAEHIASALGLDVRLESRLREINVGDWEGLTTEEAREAYPEIAAEMATAPETTRYPGGESFRELADRVMLAIAELASAHAGKSIALVTHGGALRSIMARQLGYDWSRRERFVFENCGILKLSWGPEGPRFAVPAPLLQP